MTRPRTLVIGGGIAGVAVAAPLALESDVTLAEKESSLAYHTTGRSAALLFDTYGARPLWPLTRASRRFFEHPPDEVVDHPLLRERGALTIGFDGESETLDSMYAESAATGVDVARLGRQETIDVCPALGDSTIGAVFERDAADMDVAAIHQAFVRLVTHRNGVIRTKSEVVAASAGRAGWTVTFADGSAWNGDVIVNAAGAWGDVVAERCGISPVGLEPMRRTAFMVAAPARSEDWPLVVDLHHSFYFKPDGSQLLCSPADESLEEPKDTRAQEVDVALAIERINQVTTLGIRSVRSSWAGQRTFVSDRSMVIGPDPGHERFIWLVGQGGTGIQTAPAAGELAASLALGDALPRTLTDGGVTLDGLHPARLR